MVLKNLLGITLKEVMDEAEARALEQATDVLIRAHCETHRFTAADLCDCRRTWLGDIYEWAGHYRRVNVSKDGFPFAAAAQVPALMDQFERDELRRCTPCTFADRAAVIRALAETHVDQTAHRLGGVTPSAVRRIQAPAELGLDPDSLVAHLGLAPAVEDPQHGRVSRRRPDR